MRTWRKLLRRTVYVLYAHDYEQSYIGGVYATLDAAMKEADDQTTWEETPGYYGHEGHRSVVVTWYSGGWEITERLVSS